MSTGDDGGSGTSAASQGQETAQFLPSELITFPCFSPTEDPTTLAVRWRRWRRSFNLHVTAKGVTNDAQKVALLLHTGGPDLQELYFSLVSEEVEKIFDENITFLDGYFLPKVNVPFERHVFRQLGQLSGETVDQFVCRLRQKALTCDFHDVDESIRDQLIEKCANSKLRRKLLEKNNATLKDFKDIARAHEAVDVQMQSLAKQESSEIHAVGQPNMYSKR